MNIRKKDLQLDILFVFLLLLVILPFWAFELPGMVDAPQHATQFRMMEELIKKNPFYTDRFQVNWFTPYLLSNLLQVILSIVTSPVTAIKISVTCYILIFSLVSRGLILYFNKPREFQIIPLCFLYTQSINMGFIPYITSISFGAIWLYLILTNRCKPDSKVNIAVSLSLAFFHAIGWFVIVFNIFLIHIYRKKFRIRSLLGVTPLLLPVLPILLWLYFSIHNQPSTKELDYIIYQPIFEKIILFFFSVLTSNIIPISTVSLFSIFIIIYRFTEMEKAFSMFYFMLFSNVTLYLITPTVLFSTAFISDRIFIMTPLLFPLILKKTINKPAFIYGFSLVVLLVVTSRLFLQIPTKLDMNEFRKVTGYIRSESSVFYISDYEDLEALSISTMPIFVYLHYPHWISSERNLTIDYNFAYVHNMLVRYKSLPDWTGLTSYQYNTLDWNIVKSMKYDYVLIRDCHDNSHKLETIQLETRFKLTSSLGCWHLLEKFSPN